MLLADAPVRLKKELDTILTLQGDLDAVEKAIHVAKITLSQSSTPSKLTKILRGLEEMHDQLSDKVEELYVSLNIQESYPDLQGVGLDSFKHFSWLVISKSTSENEPLGVFLSGINWIKQLVGEATLSVCFF